MCCLADREIGNNDLFLLDLGAEYYRYGSDITCTFPISGAFSEDQRMVYQAVLAAHQAVLAAIKPGISWPVSHAVAFLYCDLAFDLLTSFVSVRHETA